MAHLDERGTGVLQVAQADVADPGQWTLDGTYHVRDGDLVGRPGPHGVVDL